MDTSPDALRAADAATLSFEERVVLLEGLESLIRRATARQQRVLAAIELDPPLRIRATDSDRQVAAERNRSKHYVREELAALLHLAPAAAANRFGEARVLATSYPQALELVEAGTITFWHARALLEETAHLADDAVAEVQQHVLPSAGEQTLAQFRTCVKRAVLAVDPSTARRRHQKSASDRRIWIKPAENGMAWCNAFTTATDAMAIMNAAQARADRIQTLQERGTTADGAGATDSRTADQRRIDALVDICLGSLNDAEATGDEGVPTQQGHHPRIQVTVAASTLLGLDYQPGELLGYGPIPASLALAAAFDPTGTWRRLVTDPIGNVIDRSEHSYRPSADLRDFVIARDQTCRGIGCNRPAQRCELDHITPNSHGGPTTAANLHATCSRDHHLKHDTTWQVERKPSGITVWHSPTGRRYEKPPDHVPRDTILDSPPMSAHHERPTPAPGNEPEPPPSADNPPF